MLRVLVAGLGLALLLVTAGDGAAQAQRPRPVQTVPQVQTAPEPAPTPERTPSAEPPAPSAEPPAEPAPSATPPSGPPPLVEQRSGQQGPVSIRVIPTPKTEEELIAERQDREQRSALESNLMLLATLLVAIGFLQFVAIAALGLFLWIALTAMRRPVEVAERNLEIAQRAFVYVGSLDSNTVGTNLKVTPVLENGGTTPTRSLRISTHWRAWHGELPPDFVYNYVQSPDRLFLGARGRVKIGSVLIPMRDIQAAIDERLQLYFWGRATYEDMFEGSEPHFVEFCYRLDAVGATPDKVSLTFQPYGPHNRTEQDSQHPGAPNRR